MPHTYQVAVATPAHSGIQDGLLSYHCDQPVAVGSVVLVPLGRRTVLGIVWSAEQTEPDNQAYQLKSIEWVSTCTVDADWMRLIQFASRYYHYSLGELAIQMLPPIWRKHANADKLRTRLERFEKKQRKLLDTQGANTAEHPSTDSPPKHTLPTLNTEQQNALNTLPSAQSTCLLWGVTGSGKTEVYLQHIARLLAADTHAQILVLVPEINLTPQLEAIFHRRFQHLLGTQGLVSIHSGLTPVQRETHWLLAQQGRARIVLGTRTAVFTPMPHLRMVIVDEEHDPSYKSQDGARYHGRDLAIYRAQNLPQNVNATGCTALLCSATPSIETWHACSAGKYQRLDLPARASGAPMAPIQLINTHTLPASTVLTPQALKALQHTLAAGGQALVFLNRRGYAPVMYCPECQWKSDCPACSATMVLHQPRSTHRVRASDDTEHDEDTPQGNYGILRCHHCGKSQAMPSACPNCGHEELLKLGAGTQQLEARLLDAIADLKNAQGDTPRLMRIDADNSKGKGVLRAQLDAIHAHEVDIIVGTQMVTKGHDFAHVQLVIGLDCDQSLYSVDFRAPELLFSQLLQTAGRAGRRHDTGHQAKVLIQTQLPQHTVYQHLVAYDYAGFAEQALEQRRMAGMPPFVHHAILRAESKDMQRSLDFLRALCTTSGALQQQWNVCVFPPIPMSMRKIAHMERAQALIEAPDRRSLHGFLTNWKGQWQNTKLPRIARWHLEIDPLHIT